MASDNSWEEITITDIIEETPEARTFVLSTTSGATINYQAGQFLTLVFPKSKSETERRSYSFSSAPLTGEPAAITVKAIPNGAFSRKLMQAKCGDQLLMSGINGFFTLPENIQDFQQLFFIAAGSGITPIFSLIKTALHSYSWLSVILIYSNRSRENTIFFKQLTGLAAKFKGRFKIDFLFSDSGDLLSARLNNSLLVSFLNRHTAGPFEKVHFFLCGPFEYMDTAMITLLTEGVPLKHIRKENFNSIKPQLLQKPPDIKSHKVFLETGKGVFSMTVQYPDSILTQALKENIPLPYSCRSGQCGSCAALCLEGKVWMAYNEVLTPKETQQGIILTCTGFPVGGDATLKI
jgi:ring-1,2-phenylacetyl-CoA epoxidase subunit PaaE